MKYLPRPFREWEFQPSEDDRARGKAHANDWGDTPDDVKDALAEHGYALRFNEALRLHKTFFSGWKGRPVHWVATLHAWEPYLGGQTAKWPCFDGDLPSTREEALALLNEGLATDAWGPPGPEAPTSRPEGEHALPKPRARKAQP